MDWRIRGRLLIGGPILIVLGLVLYFVRGAAATLGLIVIGIVLLVAGVFYKPRSKSENISSQKP